MEDGDNPSKVKSKVLTSKKLEDLLLIQLQEITSTFLTKLILFAIKLVEIELK